MTKKSRDQDENRYFKSKLLFGGILASAFGIVAELSGQNQFDVYQTAMLFAFAVCIPFSFLHFILAEIQQETNKKLSIITGAICLISYAIGIISLFFHFHFFIGIVSLVCGVILIMVLFKN
jgi:hypothetical protein